MKILKLLVIFLLPFFVAAQTRYDVVIDEIMADQTPAVSLPSNEWIELKNVSANPINLLNWRIGDATGQSGPMPVFILQPDSFVIVCTGSAVAAMQAYGRVISVTSFPSLDNDGDQLFLKSNTGMVIHAVNYSSSWYQNAVKKDGGWTLEMIDTKSPCAGMSNWKASVDIRGGSPGTKNSIDAVNIDLTGPSLKKAFPVDNMNIMAEFDEPLDSLKGATLANYSIDGGLLILSATSISPFFNQVQLRLQNPMQANTIYNLTVNNVTDCKNNPIGSANKSRVGLPVDAAAAELVINEILFNPVSGGSDFVEFYNRSNKIFDANKLYIANRNSSNAVSSAKLLVSSPFLVFPGDYLVVTENADNLSLNFFVKNPDAVFIISSMPSFPDDKGNVILLNFQGNISDEVSYNKSWHFALLDDENGISLERIDPDGPSQEAANWHSAASTAGYGTPTYKNSQYKSVQRINATIEATPKVFSPDNDGRDDIVSIQYKTTEPGYVANITIFDSNGRPVKTLVSNGILGLEGYWNWDGLDNKKMKLPVGTYVVLAEIFNLQGKKEIFKNVVVLARKLN
ncbi:MAG TPA: lamin tail domain-containing protein [Chitinophagaceae bacterium]|nr:lamin tail domain-containing protein [Chitinophagaceae bacterium]